MEAYTYQIDKHLRPWFGPMKMVEILPEHVREWVTDMRDTVDSRTKKPLSAKTIKNVFATLSSILTTALNDQMISVHPCRTSRSTATPRSWTCPRRWTARYATFQERLLDIARRIVIGGIETGELRGDLDADSLARILNAVHLRLGLQVNVGQPTDLDTVYDSLPSLYVDAPIVFRQYCCPGCWTAVRSAVVPADHTNNVATLSQLIPAAAS